MFKICSCVLQPFVNPVYSSGICVFSLLLLDVFAIYMGHYYLTDQVR